MREWVGAKHVAHGSSMSKFVPCAQWHYCGPHLISPTGNSGSGERGPLSMNPCVSVNRQFSATFSKSPTPPPPPLSKVVTVAAKAQRLFVDVLLTILSGVCVQYNGKTYADTCCALRKLPFPPNGCTPLPFIITWGCMDTG